VAWCAIPFPQYQFPNDDGDGGDVGQPDQKPRGKIPGHGEARVQVNFWFFLFVYYGFYNLVALIWITKLFNLYSLNWWPRSLGFPLTVSAIAVFATTAPIPIYLIPETNFLTVHNTAWITWTFFVMAMPLIIAFCILMTNERHLGLRHSLSETQRIFTSSWWTGEPETTFSRRDPRRRVGLSSNPFDPDALADTLTTDARGSVSLPVGMRRRWLPASFIRFVWFCLALFVGLLAYVIGEAYAEIYLRTLPHNNLETIVYVYGWIVTVILLDGLTGWILGGNEGERVGSYPLSWIFKLSVFFTPSQSATPVGTETDPREENKQVFHANLPNVRPRLVRPPPQPEPVHPPADPFFHLAHHNHARPDVAPPPRVPEPDWRQYAVVRRLPETLHPQRLHPIRGRECEHARLPGVGRHPALRRQQRRVSLFFL
jgi:hypothetical protein